jgi:hypothetical protein
LASVAETSITDSIPANAATLALVHAVLALAPREARRVERQARRAGNNGLPPHLQWGDE